jgi:MFS family permease
VKLWRVVGTLGTTQTLAWASSYYLPAMLAAPMARELGLSVTMVFAAFSLAMLLAAAVGPYAGRTIDRFGGRRVLAASNLVFAAGLACLALAQGPWTLFAAWLLIGAGMGSGLYEAGFATLVRLYGHAARDPITGITLMAGFASTIGWPLSAALDGLLGWRGACGVWAALHLVLGLPLNLSLPRAPSADPPEPAAGARAPVEAPPAHPVRAAALLAYAFAVTWFVSTAMASHLPQVLQLAGVGLAGAVFIGALIGPAQVAGRVLEFGLLRRWHPLFSARAAALGHPAGALLLMALGGPAAFAFAVLHGLGNGIMTIAKGTLPLAVFGPRGYGALTGLIMVPTRLLQAAAPLAFGWCLQRWGLGALWLSAALSASAFAALWWLPVMAGRQDR